MPHLPKSARSVLKTALAVTAEEPREKHLAEDMAENTIKETVEKAFAKADKDGRGKLTLNEFKAFVKEMEEGEEREENEHTKGKLEMMMSMFDIDGDKMLSLDEILKMMTDEDIDDKELLTRVFKSADTDGKGFLIASEVKELLLRVRPHLKADIEKNVDFFTRMDSSDGDKKVKIEEAVCLFASNRKVDVRGKMKIMFRMCDCNGDGFISKKELVNWMKFLNMFDEDEDDDYDSDQSRFAMDFMIDMMIKAADEDEDGKLNYDEFCIMNELS